MNYAGYPYKRKDMEWLNVSMAASAKCWPPTALSLARIWRRRWSRGSNLAWPRAVIPCLPQKADQVAQAQGGLHYYALLNALDGLALSHALQPAPHPEKLAEWLTLAQEDARQ